MKRYLNLITSIAICFGQLTAMDPSQGANSDGRCTKPTRNINE